MQHTVRDGTGSCELSGAVVFGNSTLVLSATIQPLKLQRSVNGRTTVWSVPYKRCATTTVWKVFLAHTVMHYVTLDLHAYAMCNGPRL